MKKEDFDRLETKLSDLEYRYTEKIVELEGRLDELEHKVGSDISYDIYDLKQDMESLKSTSQSLEEFKKPRERSLKDRNYYAI